jgi:hypothetical protein
MVGYSLINMHMGAYVFVANVVQHKSIPKINPTWDWKVFNPYSFMKDLGITIHK